MIMEQIPSPMVGNDPELDLTVIPAVATLNEDETSLKDLMRLDTHIFVRKNISQISQLPKSLMNKGDISAVLFDNTIPADFLVAVSSPKTANQTNRKIKLNQQSEA